MEINIDFGQIIQKKPNKILLQAPEGIKLKIAEIAKEIENKTGAEVIISGEPCYGACDLPFEAARSAKSDLIVHLGHTDFGVSSDIPVIYFPLEYNIEIPDNVIEQLKALPQKTVAIFSSVQFKKALDSLEAALKKQGKEINQKQIILGCSEIKSEAELNIFIGSGKFHPKALSGNVLQIDIERGEIYDLTCEIKREEMKRFARLEKLKDAKKVGILLSTKPGQYYKDYGELKARLEGGGKEAQIIALNEITDEKLMGLDFDCFINTACPRILDSPFKKPIINLRDI
jgi:2-(3-amino-3-carboxypropyl)histidine synthase